MIRVDGLEGRVAVVTGAARGIGNRIAEMLRENGALVAGFDISVPQDKWMLGHSCDVRSESDVDIAFTKVEESLGRVSVLVLNAGINPVASLEATTVEAWRDALDVNLIGSFLCARRALGHMREMGYGRVVSIASSAGKTGGARSAAAYAASKAGVMSLARSIAREYAPFGVTSNALAPAFINTEMSADVSQLANQVPVGRLGTVDDVAGLVTFLCSAHAGFITGEVTDINGGFLID
jgi:NAD(P)-dependent dehydrogenase (short-subunit alcohol dehydrogenase family)